jgi:DNA-binding GntR family transcriptional regulator
MAPNRDTPTTILLCESDRDAFHLADGAWRSAIADAVGCPGAWRMAREVKAHVARYRRLAWPQEGSMARVIGECAAILTPIKWRASPRAAVATAAHVDGLLADIPDIRRLNPHHFAERAVQHSAAR